MPAHAAALGDRLVGTGGLETLLAGSVRQLPLLVGDAPYCSRVGFKPVPKGRATMPGLVDYSRLQVFELVDGAFEGVSGPIGPDWSKALG